MKDNTREKTSRVYAFVNELLLYSGQYALFYILMNFTSDKLGYFANFGHTILLIILVAQTVFLVYFGQQPLYRLLGSLIAPLFYSLLELREEISFILNTAHIFFWIFSFLTGSLQALELRNPRQKIRQALEFAVTNLNVLTFIFIYFYFDLKLFLSEQVSSGLISLKQQQQLLEVEHLPEGLWDFLQDPAHIYILLGGLILSLSLSIGRMRIIQLKDKISELFGKYVDKDIRDIIISVDRQTSERRNLAVLFSDIRNFTAISENHTADEITKMLNFYFTQWDQTVRKFNGVIDKYIGDAVMVLFGMKDDMTACTDAVNCGLEMLERMDSLQSALQDKNLPMIENIGIGVNHGSLIVGDIGSESRRNYTVIGDTVNIASRLEALCKTYQMPLIISESTFSQLSSDQKMRFEDLGEAELKGKADRITIFGYKPLRY